MRAKLLRPLLVALPLAAMGLTAAAPVPPPKRAPEVDNRAAAERLAVMLQAARSVISANQALIDDPAIGDKHLTGEVVLTRALPIYQKETGEDAWQVDPRTRAGALLRAEMAAIVAVVNANQASINALGVEFKGFIPAIFARLVSEEFTERVGGMATMRVTAPEELVRNRKALPDTWEAETIATRFLNHDWHVGDPFAQVVASPDGPTFRIAVPEYYSTSCLSCHGGPKGSLDLTGYPREGAREGDLGGVISITLRP